MHMTVKQAAEKWGISNRRVRILCAEGKVSGVTREGRGLTIDRKPLKDHMEAVGHKEVFDFV